QASYTDATIACEGKFYPVHKLVLSTCSEYFGAIFERTPCKSPVVVLKDIECKNLEFLLDYMYVGEVNVRQNELAALIKAAECLRIKGLAVPDEDPSNSNYSTGCSTKGRSDSQRESSPPAKRRRNLQSSSENKRRESQSADDTLGLESTSSKDNNDASDDGVTPIKLEPLEENDAADFIPNSNVSVNDRVSDDGGGPAEGERDSSANDVHNFFKVNIEKEEPVHLSEYSSYIYIYIYIYIIYTICIYIYIYI
ncbi:UNVERIFIED_CONTAM: hypothetical protein GTU68_025158, partial [Idotea baltica]|nr:hypothetical protein [Idotea baltica]